MKSNLEADEKSASSRSPYQEGRNSDSLCLFDAHCHLQDKRFAGSADAVISRAKKSGVTAFMCCGTKESDWEKVHKLANTRGMYVSFGIHPCFAQTVTGAWLDHLKKYLATHPGAAVGEIGLDFTDKSSDINQQEEVFLQQLRLARELARPVSIHCINAIGRIVQLLEEEGGAVHGGLVHSYSGSKELIPVLERLGLFISFSGAITRLHNKRNRAAVLEVSPSRLLIESDSPDLSPEGFAIDAVNEPANLPLVLNAIADLRGVTEEYLAKLTMDNGVDLFAKTTKGRM